MPLLMCPNDNSAMQTLDRDGVQFDMCPSCRGVWLDRGELEKLMAAAVDSARAAAPPPPQPAPQAYVQQQPHPQAHAPWGGGQPQPQPQPYRDDRRYKDDDYKYRKKKRDSIFDIFD